MAQWYAPPPPPPLQLAKLLKISENLPPPATTLIWTPSTAVAVSKKPGQANIDCAALRAATSAKSQHYEQYQHDNGNNALVSKSDFLSLFH
jgi:hypothetical protein